jgi:large subunit ribosomal protein L5
MNKMQEIVIDKVTVNIGIGQPGERLDFAKDLIERLSGAKPVETLAKRREPVFKLRKGLPIGAKVTLRKGAAKEFLDKALTARRRVLSERNFDNSGNFSFGVAEYIDFPGAKYDPSIGMFGFDVAVTLIRRGERVSRRRIANSRVGAKHLVKTEDAIEFAKSALNAKIE